MSPAKTATAAKAAEIDDRNAVALLPERAEKVSSQLAYLARALKTPTIGRVW